MKKKKGNFKSVVVFIMVLSMLLPIACSPENNEENPSGGENIINNNENNGGTEQITADEPEEYKLPEADFGGYVMRLVTISDEYWAIPELDTESENGDIVNDEIYRRNRGIEQAFNLVINEIPGGIVSHEMLSRSVAANTDEYDLMFAHADSGGIIAALGYYRNLYDIASLNLDKTYWDQGAIQSLELMDKLYFTTSDACVMTNDCLWVIYFSKKIHQNLGLEDPYKLVREGKWTMDAMYNMAREAVKDIDGNGAFTGADQWGVASHSLAFLQFLNCQEELLVKKDSGGYPVFANPDARFGSAYSKVRSMMDESAGVYLTRASVEAETGHRHPEDMFMAELSLFCAEVLGCARIFREMTEDFGILPHPKHDEAQPKYFNATAHVVPIWAIPVTNPEPEKTGMFIDALTALSETTVTPAYYSISLEGKFARDEESIEMLDIIRSNRIYDLAVFYNWDNFYRTFLDYGTSPSGDNPVTVFDRNAERVKTQIENTIETFKKIDQ